MTNSQFRQFERLAGRWRHLHHRARPRDAGRRRRSRPRPSSTRILRAARVHLGQDPGRGRADHPGQPQSLARPVAGRRRPQDRPYRGGGLRLHRLGRPERPPPRHGRRGPGQLQPAHRGIGASSWTGASAPGRRSRCSPRASRSARREVQLGDASTRRPGRAARPRRDLSDRASARQYPGQDRLSGPGQGADRAGPAHRRPGRHRPATRRRRRCRWSPRRRSARPASSAASRLG